MTAAPGENLLERIRAVSHAARQSGALWVTPTDSLYVKDAGVAFRIYQIRKSEQRRRKSVKRQQRGDPFLPYERALLVSEFSATHVCLLNKFNIVDDHALLVTREFAAQDSPLDVADFHALCTCLAEMDGLVFYNAGRDAGASQPHKHLQLVPLPLSNGGTAVPMENVPMENVSMENVPIESLLDDGAGPPFRHALRRWQPPREDTQRAASQAHDHYLAMMDELELEARTETTPAYNLLATRRWMMLVPRPREKFHGISLNALAFAGVLLARGDEQLNCFRDQGPMAALRWVTAR